MKIPTSTLGSLLSLALLSSLPGLASAQTLGTPAWTSSTVESCNGKYYVTWSAVTDATTYDIWALWPGATSYILLKATANTATTVTAADATLGSYFEVQACNASGCGAVSSPLELPYYSGCP